MYLSTALTTTGIHRRTQREFGFLSDVRVLVDGEQRNWTQWQRRRGDRRGAAESRISDALCRLSAVAAVLRCHLLYSLHANRHPGKSHYGDRIVSHQKGS